MVCFLGSLHLAIFSLSRIQFDLPVSLYHELLRLGAIGRLDLDGFSSEDLRSLGLLDLRFI